MYDDTFNPLGIQGGSVHPSHEQTFLQLQNRPSKQSFLNMFKSKPHAALALDETLKLLKVCLLDKQSLLMKSFPFVMTYLKISFSSVIYTPVILHNQWHY